MYIESLSTTPIGKDPKIGLVSTRENGTNSVCESARIRGTQQTYGTETESEAGKSQGSAGSQGSKDQPKWVYHAMLNCKHMTIAFFFSLGLLRVFCLLSFTIL